MKVLNAHAQSIEAQAAQRLQMRLCGDARIDLNANFRVRGESKTFRCVMKKTFHLIGGQIRGRAPAPVKLDDGAFAGNKFADVVDFPLKDFNVWWRNTVILCDHDVASTKQAQALTKGKVHVKRDR